MFATGRRLIQNSCAVCSLVSKGSRKATLIILLDSSFVQIMIRARGTGIDVPVWVEREVLCNKLY